LVVAPATITLSTSPVSSPKERPLSVLPASEPLFPSSREHGQQCVRCRRIGEGAVYPFVVGRRQAIAYRVIHEERPFICDRCARARLRFTPLVILAVAAPLFFLALLGILNRLLGILLRGYPIALFRLLNTMALLYLTGVLVWLAVRQLLRIRRGVYQQGPSPDRTVTRMAMDIRKTDILRTLRHSRDDVLFIAQEDHRDRPAGGPARPSNSETAQSK
jgi:hypothetical protein